MGLVAREKTWPERLASISTGPISPRQTGQNRGFSIGFRGLLLAHAGNDHVLSALLLHAGNASDRDREITIAPVFLR